MATIYWRAGRAYLNWVEGEKRHRQSLGAVTASEAEVSFLKVPGDSWKVQIIEEDFHRPVFAVERV